MEVNVRQTFEISHKLLQSCIDVMEAFGGFYHRIRYADDYNSQYNGVQRRSVPGTCHSPLDLWNHWQQLTRDWESLDIHYYHATLADVDIKRALAGLHISVPAMLKVDAETHVDALCQIADRIRGGIREVCSGSRLPESYEAIDRNPDFVLENCEFAAECLREYAHNETVASESLSYLRRAVFKEEEACREYFNPDGPVAAPRGKPGRPADEVKTPHAHMANELRSETPQQTWAEVAHAVNRKFTLIGADRYDDFKPKPENPIREIWRLRHGDKAKRRNRD